MAKNIDRILEFIKKNEEVQYVVLKKVFLDINEATVTRNLKKLQEQERIAKRTEGCKTFCFVVGKDCIENYFEKPFFEITGTKAKEETQMIINHKMVLEYLIYYKNSLNYS